MLSELRLVTSPVAKPAVEEDLVARMAAIELLQGEERQHPLPGLQQKAGASRRTEAALSATRARDGLAHLLLSNRGLQLRETGVPADAGQEGLPRWRHLTLNERLLRGSLDQKRGAKRV